ncbi:LytTR family transcriptional regulator [Seohaeicola saemankumensis]|nr:LytTR family DNA-binding domain-containing protein [Seohaeicola saemankumensis]MCA0873166.1 LytTR family transcriptional regulator [Seohaeicola saemankumensis]
MGRISQLAAIRIVGKPFSFATDATTVLLMTIVFTPVLMLLTTIVLSPENPGSYLYFAQFVAVISACITALRRFLMQTLRWHLEIAEPAQPEEDPRLARRLPDDFEGPILRLAVRDHLVDVVTPKDTYRIRMRFADAIDEMDTVAGYCTHRSHWVARHAIAGVERETGRINLLLTNGDLVPVSRSYRPDLEEAGILDIVNHAASESRRAARP